ncbi:hypothetical protein MHN79_15170 [Vibrio sp. Of14-4]|uniref:hypothetical protein n=1 Tax=Vibrio sp. Of14-4 TaxID=2724878 RepID=UPI001EF1B6EA|nr:hypothetical protein [Vibrio sp. Of14-4]MCG7490830.1 hypothetical protein [Vibrio sp. Of14-4]
MRQRITPEQLEQEFSQEDVDKTIESLSKIIADLQHIKPSWLSFCREKSQLASDSFSFLFKQWVRLHRNGYPSVKQDYLRLVERQMMELKQVYIALFNLHPGLIYEQRDASPELFVWLMLEPEFSDDPFHLDAALSSVQDMHSDIAMLMFVQAKVANLDKVVAQYIEGGVDNKQWCFELLKWRQTLSIGLTKYWLKNNTLNESTLHETLTRFDVSESTEWLSQQNRDEDYLFELLLAKHDRGSWFRKRFGTQESALSSSKLIIYAKLLDLKEFDQFDPTSHKAPIQLFLSAHPKWIDITINHLICLDDEDEATEWLFSLYTIYGDAFPLKPNELDIEYDLEEAKKIIQDWYETQSHLPNKQLRCGEVMSYQTSIRAMQDPLVPKDYREWIWRQLCINGRVYMPWHWIMPCYQQDWVFDKMQQQTAASERFDLRDQNATVGY